MIPRLRKPRTNTRLSVLVAIGLVACGEPTSEVVISVDTDLNVPSEIDEVLFVAMRADRTPVERSMHVGDRDELPVELGLTHDGGPLGPVDVRVVGLLAGREIVERRLRFDFVRGRTLAIRVALSRDCVDVSCPEEMTCAGGECRDVRLRPDELLPWMPDAGSGCVAESCNGVDDDCDGMTDEGFDLSSDSEHCGACGQRCVAGPSSTGAACVAGVCELDCVGGLADCDGEIDNGCETSLDSDANCGACGRACERFQAATECNAGRCEVLACNTGFRDCDGNPDSGCESSLTDRNNCGGCGVPCSLFNAVAMCGTGVCILSSCEPGFDNCDARTENGCEADVRSDVFHCAGCGRRCDEDAPNASDVCVEGACDAVCHPGWADCDGVLENGCETDLSNPETCGACGNRCSGIAFLCSGTTAAGFECIPPPCMDPPTRCGSSCVDTDTNPAHCGGCSVACPAGSNAVPECVAAGCRLRCDVGYGDCDGEPVNGCETPFNDPLNCGACGRQCELPGAIAACLGATCIVAGCEPGRSDCNVDPMDGCETDITSLSNCGGCGTPCTRPHAIADCSTGSCSIGVCEAGWGDCDGIDANGCEAPLSGCETCAGSCVLAHGTGECVADACRVAACESGWGDCDGSVGSGCELPLDGLANCGGCGVACDTPHATPSCATGACTVESCDLGWGDCDSAPGNGCESDLTLPSTCGSCSETCLGSEVCFAAACRGPTDFINVSASAQHTCGIDVSGQAWCWGEGSDGRLGQGAWADSVVPVQVEGLDDAIAIDAGGNSTCAVRASGRVACWGSNGRGQLGAPGPFARNTPFDMPITDAAMVSVGAEYACAVRVTGNVLCWGRNNRGQLGIGSTSGSEPPVVLPLNSVAAVTTGWEHTCAVRTSGELLCWGRNDSGQLGDGTTTDRHSPLTVGLSRVLPDAAVGQDHTCALSDGAVYCWGGNDHGQLGDGTMIDRLTPVAVGIVATDVDAGRDFSCAAVATGIRCWGNGDDGQRGDGTGGDVSTPSTVSGVGTGMLAVGERHSCVIDPAGLRCWGPNEQGQLGDGTRIDAMVPAALVVP